MEYFSSQIIFKTDVSVLIRYIEDKLFLSLWDRSTIVRYEIEGDLS